MLKQKHSMYYSNKFSVVFDLIDPFFFFQVNFEHAPASLPVELCTEEQAEY